MPHIKNALIRYRIIDRMIRNPYKTYPSKSDLREACEESLFGSTYGDHICDSTIEKDLFAMRMEHDAPIKYSRKHEGYFYEDPDYTINDIPLSEDELESIRFAVQTLQQFQEVPYFKEFGSAIDKIATRVAVAGSEGNETSAFIGFETAYSSIGNQWLPLLLTAIQEKKTCQFTYASFKTGIAKERNVLPVYLKEYRNRWYLISFDLEKSDWITYALERMDGLVVNEAQHLLKEAFNPSSFFAETIGITTEKKAAERIALRVNDIASKYIESQPLHSSQEKIGTNQFVLTVQINEELIRTLLGFMGELQIISPAHLVQTWNERIQKQLSIETHGNIL
ncbi:MAG: helix-turn-helix transcriptional regulator [Flavobacteriales bacterium]|jgi:predicted DNA-binding transcriptional regulator YafY